MSGKNSPNSTNSPPTSTTNINNNLAYQRSSKEMSTSAAASAAATALALDLKPKHPISDTAQPLLLPQLPLPQQNHLQQHQQKIKKCALTRKRITSFSKVLKRPLTRSFNQKLFSKTFKAFTTAKPLSNRFIPQFKTTFSSSNNPSILTKENFLFTLDLLAVVRRNASDKLKLIQMVHDNPILWDSRLPNFKGAEEEKNRAWEHIGKEFNAPGRRVARAFKSLRESYRRELAHVKLMGNNFKPKWSLYEAMDFLRDVIRERKGGSHATEHNGSSLGLNLSALAHHMTSTVNNNMVNNNNNNNNFTKPHYKLNALHSSFNDSALNLSKCSSSLNVSNDYYFDVKTELELSNQNANPNVHTVIANGNSNNIAVNIPPAHQNSQHNDSRVSSTRNDSSNQNNNNFDDLDNCSVRSGEDGNSSAPNTALSHQGSDEVEELEAIDADFPYPLILNSNSPATNAIGSANKRKRKNLHSNADDEEEEEDDDDYEGQMLQQHRHLRAQQNQANGLAAAGLMTGMSDMMPPPQTVREVLNSKFCGFISAKLNSMEDSEADNLMNKILMLLVQSQMTQTTNNSALAIPNGQNEFK